jgi:hypothetical protein
VSAFEEASIEVRLARIERALKTLSWWLVEAQTGFGVRDARGIDDILEGREKVPSE